MPSPSPPRAEESATATAPEPESSQNAPPRPDRTRSRSRSPRRSPPHSKPKNFSGLKWKDTKKNDASRPRDDYRRDNRDRDRSDRRDGGGGGGRDEYRSDRRRGDDRRDDRYSDRREGDRDRDRRRDGRRDDGRRDGSDRRRDDRDRDGDRKPKEKKEKGPAAPAVAANGEAMIIVTVNDRLGTKTQVPCLPSDPIKVLKAMVAAKIGRPMHEIMLKRQGERPFHDSLTLADYSISNGVQIDLELNTGD